MASDLSSGDIMTRLSLTFNVVHYGDRKKTWVDFSVTTTPGGVIPAWVTGIASRNIPRKTLVNLWTADLKL